MSTILRSTTAASAETPCSPGRTCAEMATDFETAILDVAQKHGRYKPNAYRFTLDAVHHTVDHLREIRHVTGGELLVGIRDLALTRFGPMAKTVFEQWGIGTTEDFG